jgi:hypothetical protein
MIGQPQNNRRVGAPLERFGGPPVHDPQPDAER